MLYRFNTVRCTYPLFRVGLRTLSFSRCSKRSWAMSSETSNSWDMNEGLTRHNLTQAKVRRYKHTSCSKHHYPCQIKHISFNNIIPQSQKEIYHISQKTILFFDTTKTASKLILLIDITGPQVWKLQPTSWLMNNDTVHYCFCFTSVRKTDYINTFNRIWLAKHLVVTIIITCALRSDLRYMGKPYSIQNKTANGAFQDIVHRLCQGVPYFKKMPYCLMINS